MKSSGGALRTTWIFLSVTLALSSGVAQLVVSGTGKMVLGAISGLSLVLFTAQFIRHTSAFRIIQWIRERDELREALHYIAEAADAPFSEKIILTIRIGGKEGEDKVRQEVTTTPSSPLRYRAFYPIIPDSRKAPKFEDMNFSGAVITPESTSIQILPVQNNRLIRVIALFRPAIKGPCHWTVEYFSPGLWDPLRKSGRDALTWRIRHHPNVDEKTRTEVIINFMPPIGATLLVAERAGKGVMSTALELTGGSYVVWQSTDFRADDVDVFDIQLVLGK